MIFTDRTIAVKKGTSSIDDTIVLYRGDKEVEIRFTLNESSPFRFGSGASPNIIEKTEAAYGQLIIKRPNDLPAVFSEIAPTNEGKIVFTITTEMIDEITEVGNYTFQIRLLDESMNSRATLPEVIDGIEIREPIATEDISDTNEVGIAAVGYALTTAGTQEDTFDTQGNYNKTTWGTGDRITAAKLNKMEAGIDGVNNKIANLDLSGVDLTGYAKTEDIPTRVSQLTNDANYTTKTYVDDAIGNIEMTGGSNINDTTASTTTTYSSNKIESIKDNLNSQIKEIVNVADLAQEGNNVYIKDSNGNKVGNGITIQSSSTGSGGNIISSSDYSYEYMGTPFPALNNYQSWPIAGVQYDKSIDRIVCLVTDADKHVDSIQFKLSLYTLNPQTAEIKLIQTLRDNTVDPVVNLSNAFASQRGFLIDNDTGIYYKFHFGDDNIPKACKSEDKGITWTDITINETNTAWTVGGNGQIIKTSTGRIICGLFGNGVAYTDDYFANLTYCNNTKLPSNGENTCHEYEIIEYPDGTLQRLMRRTWQSTNNGVWNGTKVIEPAWVSTSSDNGVTWTTPVASTSVVNMSATNCVSYIDGDILNLFVGCRYPVTDNAVSAMFYYQCTLDDAKNDNFGEPTTLFYGNTNDYINFGNLAACKDDKGNFHLFYNDNALSSMGADECRWHYIRIAKNVVNNNAILDVPVNKNIQAYNANAVDSLLEAVYAHIQTVKDELLIKIGEMPDSGTVDNPTYWVSDGLISMFTIDEAHFDTANSKFTPAIGNYSLYVAGGDYNYSAQSTYSNLYLYSNDKNLLNDTFINSTEGYTIEVDYLTQYQDGSGSSRPFNLNSNGQIWFIGGWNINLLSYSTSSNDVAGEASVSVKDVYDSSRKRNTLTFTYDRTNDISSVYSNGVKILTSEGLTVTDGNSWYIANANNISSRLDRLALMRGEKASIRCYNKPLTAEQILTNANYSNSLT